MMEKATLLGLAGERIPLEARIVCIADSFDAMTSDRSYRPRYTLYKALDELKAGKEKQFDSELVDVFVKMIIDHREEIAEAVHMEFVERHNDDYQDAQ